MNKAITIFDPFIQEDAPHLLTVNNDNGEIIAKSIKSDHFVKFAPGTSVSEIEGYIGEYKSANEGQVTVEQANAAVAEQQSIIDQIGFDESNDEPVADSESTDQPEQ